MFGALLIMQRRLSTERRCARKLVVEEEGKKQNSLLILSRLKSDTFLMMELGKCRQCRKGSVSGKIVTEMTFGQKFLCFVFLAMVTVTIVTATESNDIQSLLNNFDNQDKLADSKPIAKQLRLELEDAMVKVGHLFSYSLPKELAIGYKVKLTEAGKERLPKWLEHDKDSNSLKGIASHEDLGHHYVEIKATHNSTAAVQDVFKVSVVKDLPHTTAVPLKTKSDDSHKAIYCQTGQPVTKVTLVVDTDFDHLTPKQKVKLLTKMASHLTIQEDNLQLKPVGKNTLFDASALVAGPGDVKTPTHSGAFVSWKVGCGNVESHHMPVLQKLEITSKDGSMKANVGHPIVGWYVTAYVPQVKQHAKRLVRRAASTATPTLAVSPPSELPLDSSSAEQNTLLAPEMSRVIPGQESPTTRKPHRTKTAGRHYKTSTARSMAATPTSPEMSKMAESTVPMVTYQSQVTTPTLVQPSVTDSGKEGTTPRVTQPIQPSPVITSSTSAHKTTATKTMTTTQTRFPPLTPPISPPPPVTTRRPPKFDQTTRHPIENDTPKSTDKAVTQTSNQQPAIKNQLEPINVLAGQVLNYTIPADTFYDYEDGGTQHLTLVVTDSQGFSLKPNSGIQFDPKQQRLWGLPMWDEVGSNKYIISAVDNMGKIAEMPFVINVVDIEKKKEPNHEFSMTINMNYSAFIISLEKRIEITNKLAMYYGDANANSILITDLKQGSVIYKWANKSLDQSRCPVSTLSVLVRKLITVNQTVSEDFQRAMAPYKIMGVGLQPSGNCKFEGQESVEPTPPPPAAGGSEDEDEILITTVIPAVVIAAMLLLAGIIACILYRKKRKGKMSDEDQNTFINKGIPIIFADELEDKPDPPTKPLIMEDEKPPLPPPEYHGRSPAGGSPHSTPPSDHKGGIEVDEAEEADASAPLYQPPPPMYAPRDNKRQRPNVVLTGYRSPPAYVPP
ncbi:dystroglycan isoform X2 [Lingula anatina]|uniref:Dystroglycan 1 n=1 Tax=Lingula anatina TaxID=7574 RepID=A0A1S3JI54_LINAN|nr:dystroglycan isoform X2 [Lingula anatina]|eukprot:XP_013409821.1 dystroglycan isoform X2 [Lingula anatina]